VNTSLAAVVGLIVSVCVAEVTVVGVVLAAVIVGVPARVSLYVKLALLEPLAIDREVGEKVTVPVEMLESVTVLVVSAVFGLPNWSCRCTVMLLEVAPAARLTGEVVNTSLLTPAAATGSCCVAEIRPVEEAVIVGVPALVSV
jgi:hypothetical protein